MDNQIEKVILHRALERLALTLLDVFFWRILKNFFFFIFGCIVLFDKEWTIKHKKYQKEYQKAGI